MHSRVHCRVRGRVQGVFFRQSTFKQATQLDLAGWVRNCPDGSVEVIAEGPEAALQSLVAWLQRGPKLALVSRVEAEWGDASRDLERFEVR